MPEKAKASTVVFECIMFVIIHMRRYIARIPDGATQTGGETAERVVEKE